MRGSVEAWKRGSVRVTVTPSSTTKAAEEFRLLYTIGTGYSLKMNPSIVIRGPFSTAQESQDPNSMGQTIEFETRISARKCGIGFLDLPVPVPYPGTLPGNKQVLKSQDPIIQHGTTSVPVPVL